MTEQEAKEIETIERDLRQLSQQGAVLRQVKARIYARVRMRRRREPAGAE